MSTIDMVELHTGILTASTGSLYGSDISSMSFVIELLLFMTVMLCYVYTMSMYLVVVL